MVREDVEEHLLEQGGSSYIRQAETDRSGGRDSQNAPRLQGPKGQMKKLSVRRCQFEVWSDGSIIGINGSASLTEDKRTGRWIVNFSRNGHKSQFIRCRLVAAAFHGGMRPPKGWWVKHLNDDPADDRAENLAWETRGKRLGRSIRAKRVVVDGHEMCATEAARKARKNPAGILRRLKNGYSIESALNNPRYGHHRRRSDAVLIKYKGERLTAREWGTRTGIPYKMRSMDTSSF